MQIKREDYVQVYWRLMHEALSAELPLADFILEMETLAEMTDSEPLKRIALRSAHRFDGPYKISLQAAQ